MDPSDWEVSCRIGIVYSELGVVSYSKECFTESEAHFTSAITHNPKVSRFYTCRAKARLMRKVRVQLIMFILKACVHSVSRPPPLLSCALIGWNCPTCTYQCRNVTRCVYPRNFLRIHSTHMYPT